MELTDTYRGLSVSIRCDDRTVTVTPSDLGVIDWLWNEGLLALESLEGVDEFGGLSAVRRADTGNGTFIFTLLDTTDSDAFVSSLVQVLSELDYVPIQAHAQGAEVCGFEH